MKQKKSSIKKLWKNIIILLPSGEIKSLYKLSKYTFKHSDPLGNKCSCAIRFSNPLVATNVFANFLFLIVFIDFGSKPQDIGTDVEIESALEEEADIE